MLPMCNVLQLRMVSSASPPLPPSSSAVLPPYREVELAGRDKWEPLLADMGTLASPRVHPPPPPETKIRSYFPNLSVAQFPKPWSVMSLSNGFETEFKFQAAALQQNIFL